MNHAIQLLITLLPLGVEAPGELGAEVTLVTVYYPEDATLPMAGDEINMNSIRADNAVVDHVQMTCKGRLDVIRAYSYMSEAAAQEMGSIFGCRIEKNQRNQLLDSPSRRFAGNDSEISRD